MLFSKQLRFAVCFPYRKILQLTDVTILNYVLVCGPGPEIDPFWYVGRGVRPIGRFGKRHSSVGSLSSGGIQPVIRTLELLLHSLRNKQNLENVLNGEDRDWLQ